MVPRTSGVKRQWNGLQNQNRSLTGQIFLVKHIGDVGVDPGSKRRYLISKLGRPSNKLFPLDAPLCLCGALLPNVALRDDLDWEKWQFVVLMQLRCYAIDACSQIEVTKPV